MLRRVREGECELTRLADEAARAARDLQSARTEHDATVAAAEAARDRAAQARTEAQAARTEAEHARTAVREGEVQLRELAARIERHREQLTTIEECNRLEQSAAADLDERVAAARRVLAETEQVHTRQLEALEALRRCGEEAERGHAELVVQCDLLRAQESELRESIAELQAQRSLLNGETVPAEPKLVAPSDRLLLPGDLDPLPEDGRPADWVGGLRGLESAGEHGRELLERIAPMLDRHPDRRMLDAWARDGRTVFLLCETPDEASRLKQLIDVWGEVDPNGVASLAPTFQSTKSWFAAPSRVPRGRRGSRSRARARRQVAKRRSR
ncbi:MAG: hypothetical protein ACYTG2_14035 [Planctomycetota bacterium]